MSTDEVDSRRGGLHECVVARLSRDAHNDRILRLGYLKCVGKDPMGTLATVDDGSAGMLWAGQT